jgi:hypothetical protein
MQLYLKFRFGVRIRLVDGIAPVAPGRRNRTLSSAIVTDISPRFSSSTRLYRSKSFLFISDFV